jgi:hypothetical protein
LDHAAGAADGLFAIDGLMTRFKRLLSIDLLHRIVNNGALA